MTKSTTEERNPRSMNLDQLSIIDAVKLMNQEDQYVLEAIADQYEEISKAIEMVVEAFNQGGRLIYMGAGTSGRLGVLDAVECLPTFGMDENRVLGLIAGGDQAIVRAVEGAEDSKELAVEDLTNKHLTDKDVLIGIAASGRTPYVIGGLDYGREVGAKTVSIACTKNAKISLHADQAIEVETGPEILTGSTRLKAGTAQKMVLNMISTISMVQIGKVYQNLMVDLIATNEKLHIRSIRIIEEITGVDSGLAKASYEESDHNLKVAIVMIELNSTKAEAEALLKAHDEKVSFAIAEGRKENDGSKRSKNC